MAHFWYMITHVLQVDYLIHQFIIDYLFAIILILFVASRSDEPDIAN